jgi:hypothetical protein
VAIAVPPEEVVNHDIVAPACDGVADNVTEPGSQRVTFATTELEVAVIVGTAVTTVAKTAVLPDLQAAISDDARA